MIKYIRYNTLFCFPFYVYLSLLSWMATKEVSNDSIDIYSGSIRKILQHTTHDHDSITFNISYHLACHPGWVCENIKVYHAIIKDFHLSKTIGELYVTPYDWVGLNYSTKNDTNLPLQATCVNGKKRYYIFGSSNGILDKVYRALCGDRKINYSGYRYHNDCRYENTRSDTSKVYELYRPEVAPRINDKVNILVDIKKLSSHDIMTVCESCIENGYPCMSIFISALLNEETNLNRRTLILQRLSCACNEEVAMGIYHMSHADGSLYSLADVIAGSGDLLLQSFYDIEAEIFSRCISRGKLQQLVDRQGLKNNFDEGTEIQNAMLVRAVGEHGISSALPYVIFLLRKSKTITLQKECIRTLGLLGYPGTVNAALNSLEKIGYRYPGKITIGAAISRKERIKNYYQMKLGVYRKNKYLFGVAEMNSTRWKNGTGRKINILVGNYIDELYNSIIRLNIPVKGSLGKEEVKYRLVKIRDDISGKSRLYLFIDNRSNRYLDANVYYYNGKYMVNDNTCDRIDYPAGIAKKYILPYRVLYRELNSYLLEMCAGGKIKKIRAKYGEYVSNELEL